MESYRKSQNSMFLFGLRATTLMAVLALSLGLAQEGQAVIIIQDQINAGWQILHHSPIGQTFTAEDAHIQSIGFWVEDRNPSCGPIDLEIELLEGAGTGGLSMGSAPIEGLSPGFEGFFDADFSSVSLTVGQTYTAIITSTSCRGGVFGIWDSNPYSGGSLILYGNIEPNMDAAFRIIPEPGTILLVGLGGLAALRKRKA